MQSPDCGHHGSPPQNFSSDALHAMITSKLEEMGLSQSVTTDGHTRYEIRSKTLSNDL